ncbi:hypothetical protein FA13DRAFT_1735837 [Coprinellus micaceus]|uniref:Uncharacterized protein n=1 Tax=Coprinellus micaceus TaxID=71717 RepID=A0A4Y7T246_COPMI|nr:hypothetical protein FA13DRAFT_1735837 [Coprinellus micaceus]
MPATSLSKPRLSHKPGRKTKTKQQPTASTESTATRQARDPSALRQRATAPTERVPQAQTRNYTTNMHGEGNAINGDFHGTLENYISRGRAKTDPPPYSKRQPYDHEDWNPALREADYASQITEEPRATLQSDYPAPRYAPQHPRPPLHGHAQTYPPSRSQAEMVTLKFRDFTPYLIYVAGTLQDPWDVPDDDVWDLWATYTTRPDVVDRFPLSGRNTENRSTIVQKGQYALGALSYLTVAMGGLKTVESRSVWVSERLKPHEREPLSLPLFYKKIQKKNGDPTRTRPSSAAALGQHLKKIEPILKSVKKPSFPIGALVLALQAEYAQNTAYHIRQMERFEGKAKKTNPGRAWDEVLELARESPWDSSGEEEEFFSGSGSEELVDDSDSDSEEE